MRNKKVAGLMVANLHSQPELQNMITRNYRRACNIIVKTSEKKRGAVPSANA
jgi:hypothetical protein